MRILTKIVILLLLNVIFGCSERTVAASITGYNHMQRLSIVALRINGTIGPDVSAQGGGKETCCISLPAKWRPDLKAKISWTYDVVWTDNDPMPRPQEKDIEIPKYLAPGQVQIHFYENNIVKVIISNCTPGHPYYPMSAEDLKPWTISGTKQSAAAAAKRGGGTIDC